MRRKRRNRRRKIGGVVWTNEDFQIGETLAWILYTRRGDLAFQGPAHIERAIIKSKTDNSIFVQTARLRAIYRHGIRQIWNRTRIPYSNIIDFRRGEEPEPEP